MLRSNSPLHRHDPFPGRQRNPLDLTSILDQEKRSQVSGSAVVNRAYPSPPMSGSSPPPFREAPRTGPYSYPLRPYAETAIAERRDVDVQHRPSDARTYPPTLNAFHSLQPSPTAMSARHPDGERGGFAPVSPSGHSPLLPCPPYATPSQATGPLSSSQLSESESSSFASSKAQRKTKGHVASACVPCKKAHLRCDAQRPCSRCLSNGKEESCVDVQHKKRGRPRLRDDRDARFDTGRFQRLQDSASRRPLDIYPSGVPPPAGEMGPASYYMRREGPGEMGMMAGSEVPSRHPPECVAYLSMDLEVINVSPTFLEALSVYDLKGRRLNELVIPPEVGKIRSLLGYFSQEQKQREPNYLPPILGRADQMIHGLGFSMEEVGRFRLDQQEILTFIAGDGHPRQFYIRIGLVKKDSYYFVVLVLSPPSRYPNAPPPPNLPQAGTQLHTAQHPQPHTYPHTHQYSHPHTHPHPPAPLEPAAHRLSDGAVQSRTPSTTHLSATPASSFSPAVSPGGGAYSAGHIDPDDKVPHQLPRSEGPHSTMQHQGYHLPPMRPQPDYTSPPHRPEGARKPERSGRVDIGGLIEKPEGDGRPY